jgi:hypothetical protein
MTFGNTRSLGVRSLAVSCILCHHASHLDVDDYAGGVATAVRKQSRTSFSRETATVCAEAPESETTRRVKEMNFLSAHQSSNPTCPAMQSVSEMCRNEVDESAPLVLPTLLATNMGVRTQARGHRDLAHGHQAKWSDWNCGIRWRPSRS